MIIDFFNAVARKVAAPAVTTLVLGATTLAPAVAAAQDAAPAKKSVGGMLDLGYVTASGNTSTTTFSFGDALTWDASSRFVVRQKLRAIYGEADDKVNAHSLDIEASGDYKLFDGVGLVAGVGFDRNRFAGIKRRYEESIGLSWRFNTQYSDSVRFTGGVLWTQQTNTELVDRNFVAIRASFVYKRPLGANATFQQGMDYIPTLENRDDWRFNSETSISASLTKALALKVVYAVRFDNLPEPTFRDTDRILSSGLQVKF